MAVALAAIAGLDLDPLPVSADPWVALIGWRAFGAARVPVTLSHRGSLFEVSVGIAGRGNLLAATPKGEVAFTVITREGARLTLERDGRRTSVVIVADDRHIGVIADGATHLFDRPDRHRLDEDETGGGDRVVAPLPGLVKTVHVRLGQKVSKGDPLVVLEAMKMQHTLAAPRDGRIAEVLTAAGEQVVEGTMLVALEPAHG
jgi:3-methylcrotonyl-CoA carboxylase alpha subunit